MSEQGRSLELGGSGSLSSRQREEQAERMEVVEPVGGPGKKRGRKRKIAIVTAAALVVLVGAAPTIVGRVGKGAVESRLSEALGGNVRIEKLGLSWVGGQSVRSLRIVDGSLREIADVDIRTDRSLLGLALNWKDLGTITVSGDVTIDEREGPLGGLEPKSKDPAPKSEGPARLPASLAGKLRAQGLSVVYITSEGEEYGASDIEGVLDLAVGGAASGTLTSTIAAPDWSGRAEITLDVTGLTDSEGLITPEKASATGSVALGGEASPIDAFVGESFDSGAYTSKVTFNATPERGTAEVVFDSSAIAASLPVTFRKVEGGYRVEAQRDGMVRGDERVVRAALPELTEAAGQSVTLESGQVVTLSDVPGVSVRLNEFGATLPTDGRGFDWSTAVLRGQVETTQLAGTLDDEVWMIEPVTLDVTTRGVERGVSVQAVTTARLDESPAGVFVLNAKLTELYDASGRLPSEGVVGAVLAGLKGGVEINDVEGALLDSLAGAWLRDAKISVVEDLGQRVDAELTFEGGASRELRLYVSSDNVRGSAGFVIEDTVLRDSGSGVRFEADSIAPLVTRQLGIEGVRLDQGGRAELWVRDVAVDLNRLQSEAETDLRAVCGKAELRIEPMTGTVLIADESHTLATSASALTVDVLNIEDGASIAGSMSLRVDDQAAGDLSVSLRASELVDETGAFRVGVPRIDGEVALRNAMTSLAQPMVQSAGLVLSEDIGPRLDIIATASVDAESRIGLAFDVKSDRLTGSADFVVADDVIRSDEQGVKLAYLNAGSLIGRFMPETISAADGGGLSLTADDITLALGETGIDWSRSELSANLGLLGVRLRGSAGEQYQADRLDMALTLDGAAGTGAIELSGLLSQSGEPVVAGGKIVAMNLIRQGALTPARVRYDGRIDLSGLPVALAAEVADPSRSSGRVLAAELIGRLVDVVLIADAASGEIGLSVSSDRLEGGLNAEMSSGDLRVTGGQLVSEIGPEVIEQIRLRAGQAAGKAEPVGARFVEPARVEMTLGAFDLLHGWSLAATGKPEVKLTASGMVEGLPIKRGEETLRSGPIGFEALIVDGHLPVGAILGQGNEQMSLAISGDVVTTGGRVVAITGGADVGFDAGRLGGPVRADVRIESLDAGLVDDVAHYDGLIAGLFGAKVDADVALTGIIADGSVGTLDGELSLTSPRLNSETPIRFVVSQEAIALGEPAQIDWRVAPEVATRYGFGQPLGAERVRVTDEIGLDIRVDRLSVSRGGGPVREGVFGIDARVDADRVNLFVPHESTGEQGGVTHAYEPVYLHISGDAGQILIDGNGQPTDADREPITLVARVESFAAEDGSVALNRAKIDGQILAKDAPTAMIDGLLAQNGLLLEVLGPSTMLDVKASDLQADGGALTLDLQTTRASGKLVGKMYEGRLIAIEPAELVVREVRPELGEFIGEALPVIGRVTKGPDDGPAQLTVNVLEIPLVRTTELSRLQDLQMEAVVDLGTARFQTSSIFSKVMKVAKQQSEGGIGRRMSPVNFTINSGVLKYPRTKIPIGEFTIESAGTIRLTDGYIDVVTYVPMAALTEEALGMLKTGVTSLLGRQIPLFESITMVPWRTKGMPGEQKTLADLELLMQNVGDTLNPLDLINKGLGSIQDLVIDKPKPKNDEDE